MPPDYSLNQWDDFAVAIGFLAVAVGILVVAFKYGKRAKRGTSTAMQEGVRLTNLAGALIEKEQYEQAIADCDEAVRLQSTLAEAFHTRGRAWLKKKQPDMALADFNDALRL